MTGLFLMLAAAFLALGAWALSAARSDIQLIIAVLGFGFGLLFIGQAWLSMRIGMVAGRLPRQDRLRVE